MAMAVNSMGPVWYNPPYRRQVFADLSISDIDEDQDHD